LTQNNWIFENLIKQFSQRAAADLVACDGICAFKTADGVQWQISQGQSHDLITIESNLGLLAQMPENAATLMLQLNGDHSLTRGAAVAASKHDGMVRLQYMVPISALDGVKLEAIFCSLVDIRDSVAKELNKAPDTSSKINEVRNELLQHV
jgi:hypothetical protein